MEKYTSNIYTPKISIAPMVDKSHRHFRYFCRILNKEAILYSEMVTAQAIINGDLDKILYFREDEGNVALQIQKMLIKLLNLLSNTIIQK